MSKPLPQHMYHASSCPVRGVNMGCTAHCDFVCPGHLVVQGALQPTLVSLTRLISPKLAGQGFLDPAGRSH